MPDPPTSAEDAVTKTDPDPATLKSESALEQVARVVAARFAMKLSVQDFVVMGVDAGG